MPVPSKSSARFVVTVWPYQIVALNASAASPLIAFYDVTDTPTNGGDITIQWAAAASGGVLKLA